MDLYLHENIFVFEKQNHFVRVMYFSFDFVLSELRYK